MGLPDLLHAARVIQAAPVENRKETARQLVWRAHVADKYVKRLRKLHPEWGDGSLRGAAVASGCLTGQPFNSLHIQHCILILLQVLRDTEHKSSRKT
ncbi:hypothetical protein DSW25_08455 [Sulfitobacter donghicola DSW-25 = KCTC 12864 = JCM 14565]|uniref:DUF7742 domain-containing protein n=1 Tax=Sulfitobacter donghicola DSW-25 = KCTC 12864 = JCM 14565 TaxID=1300350 RepID=A0A073IKV7_9RHOB|nr:hypothetical protein DSW25_08455 [Sulfitobacter donghicola DSW-25 = KCTC 12864 = JCM 14565]